MEHRNFVSVVPAAKKSKLGPIFFQNIRVIYKLSVKKQETGQKTGKKPPKKVVFPAPPISWLSFSEKGPGPFPDFRKRSRSFSGFPEKDPVPFRISGKDPGHFLLEQNRTQIWYFSSGWICWKHHKLLLLSQMRPLLYLRLSWAWRIT